MKPNKPIPQKPQALPSKPGRPTSPGVRPPVLKPTPGRPRPGIQRPVLRPGTRPGSAPLGRPTLPNITKPGRPSTAINKPAFNKEAAKKSALEAFRSKKGK